MSDPVTDVEIEDVLSSIRRLVGDEHRAKPQMAPEPAQINEPAKPARLVLTPSLLVPVPDTEPESEPATDSDLPEQISEAGFTLESDPAEDEFEAEASSADKAITPAEMDFVFQSSQAHSKAAVEKDAEQAAWADPESNLFDASGLGEDTDKLLTGDDAQPNREALEPQETTSPFDALAQTTPSEGALEQTDPDQPIVDDVAGDPFEAGTDLSDPKDPFASDQDDAEDSESDNEPDSEPDFEPDFEPEDHMPYSTATLGAKIAALEAKIGQTQDQWEPDGELGDDYAGTRVETIEWQDHGVEDPTELRAATSPVSEPEPTPNISDDLADQTNSVAEATEATEAAAQTTPEPLDAEPESDEIIDLLAGDDAILDEESLRELVADIVRQELQGALGERITRNVRKLVRREIHRALTAQELD